MARTYKAAAAALGRKHGENAYDWWQQYFGGGRDTRSTADIGASAQRVLDGIEDGDPEILDGLPHPDLSGQYADDMTPGRLWNMVGGDPCHTTDERLHDLCDVYETRFSETAMRLVAKHCRSLVRAAHQEGAR